LHPWPLRSTLGAMADLSKARLGAYNARTKTRILVVPVDGPDDDPRGPQPEQPAPAEEKKKPRKERSA